MLTAIDSAGLANKSSQHLSGLSNSCNFHIQISGLKPGRETLSSRKSH